MQLPSRRFRTVTWREGTNAALSSRFAAIRVHCTYRAAQPVDTLEEQWLLVEWPREDVEPTRYCLSTLPADTPIKELVRLAKLRWRIERDYHELKQELGLGHFE
jgi:SRSO17 transposase